MATNQFGTGYLGADNNVYPLGGSTALPTWNTNQQAQNYPSSNSYPQPAPSSSPISSQPDYAAINSATPFAISPQFLNNTNPTGQILGASTAATSTPSKPSTSNSTPSWDQVYKQYYGGWDPAAAQADFRAKGSNVSAFGAPQPAQPDYAAINAAYNPLLGSLNEAQQTIQGLQPGYVQDVNNFADTSRQQATNAYNTTNQTLTNQGVQGAQQRDKSIANAQRLYQELQQANQQRFGAGATGQFASELQGRELQQNTGSANDQYTNLVQQLGQKKIEVDANYQTGLKQISDQQQSSINQINRDFQDKINQINQQRGAVEGEKAQARLGALQQYKDQVYQIQLQSYQYKQQLEAMRIQAHNGIQSNLNTILNAANTAQTQGQSGLNSYLTQTDNLGKKSYFNPTYSNNPQSVPGDYVGQIMNSNVRKDQFGNIIPASFPTQ